MAFGKFLTGLFGKPGGTDAPKDNPTDTRPKTAENVFGDLLDNLEKPLPQVQPAGGAGRKPVAVLPSYIPKENEEESLKRRLANPGLIENEDPDTEVDLDPFAGLPAEKSGAARPREAGDQKHSTPWPDTPVENVVPRILRLDSLAVDPQEVDTEHDSDIFYPLGHPSLKEPTTAQPTPGGASPESGSRGNPAPGLPPVAPDKKPPTNLGAAQKVGFGLRLAAKLAAANRCPTPPPDQIRVRVPRRAMSDSELIPPLFFKNRRRGGL